MLVLAGAISLLRRERTRFGDILSEYGLLSRMAGSIKLIFSY